MEISKIFRNQDFLFYFSLAILFIANIGLPVFFSQDVITLLITLRLALNLASFGLVTKYYLVEKQTSPDSSIKKPKILFYSKQALYFIIIVAFSVAKLSFHNYLLTGYINLIPFCLYFIVFGTFSSFAASSILGIILGLLLKKVMGFTEKEQVNFLIENLFSFWLLGFCMGYIFLHLLNKKNQNNFYLEMSNKLTYLKNSLEFKTSLFNIFIYEFSSFTQGIGMISEKLSLYWEKISDNQKFEYSKIIYESNKKISNQISNLADLEKINNEEEVNIFTKTTLSELTKKVIEKVEQHNSTSPKMFLNFCEHDSNDVELYIHEKRILQVIDYLIKSSLHLRIKQGLRISIKKVQGRNILGVRYKSILISIEDINGSTTLNLGGGIFQPFAKDSNFTEDTDPLLALCSAIVLLHKGFIWTYKTNTNTGLLGFSIPYGQELEVEKPKSSTQKSILLVDDEQSCLVSGSMILKIAGYKVSTAEGGAQALKMLAENEYDLILLDLMMYDIYGWDVLNIIKKDEKLKSIPVILQTGVANKEEVSKGFLAGVKGYVSKPYDRKIMLEIINAVFEESSS